MDHVKFTQMKDGDVQLADHGQHVGADPCKTRRYKGHPYVEDCKVFCERRDQTSVDPAVVRAGERVALVG